MGQCQLGQIGAAIMAGATAAQRLEEAHASPRHIRNLINEARNEGGWEGFRSVLEDLEPTQAPPSSTEDDASASDSDADEEAAAWWRREHGAAAVDAPEPAAPNRPAAADRQDDARWEGPMYDGGNRQPQRRQPPPSSKRKTLYDVLGVAVEAPPANIKKAYRALALRLHPDKCASPTANERFKAVQEAYATLGDRSRRAAYDASL